MPEQDKTPEQREKCQYREDYSKPRCGSEERLYRVSGRSRTWDQPKETPVCERHVPDAIKNWKVDGAEKVYGIDQKPI